MKSKKMKQRLSNLGLKDTSVVLVLGVRFSDLRLKGGELISVLIKNELYLTFKKEN